MVAISGFRASDIGQYGIQNLDWYTDPLFQSNWWDVPVPMGALYDIFRPWRDPPTGSGLPSVGLPAPAFPQGAPVSPVVGPQNLPTPFVIDPDSRPTETVFETEDEPWIDRTRETDWDYVYEQYVILNAPEADVPFHDNIDWGTVVGGLAGGVFDPLGLGSAARAAFSPPGVVPSAQTVPQMGLPATGVTTMATGTACPPVGPKYGKICLATGQVTPLRRRRRRRLLTSSDIKDLAALKAIVGGAALQGAVVQAIRR